jgi:hypothetical protein
MSKIPIIETAGTEILSVGSRLMKKAPLVKVNDFTVGNNTIPKGWFRYGTRVSEMGPWVEYPGDKTSTRLPIPRKYPTVGILGVDISEFEAFEASYSHVEHREALGIVPFLGESAMIGLLAEGEHFSECERYPDQKLMEFGIGYEAFKGTFGFWLPDERRLAIPEGVHGVAYLPKADAPPMITKA